MPRSAFISGIVWREMNISEFDNDLQATLSVFLLQIDCQVWFSRWMEFIRLRLLDRIVKRSVIVNPQIARPVTKLEGLKCQIP